MTDLTPRERQIAEQELLLAEQQYIETFDQDWLDEILMLRLLLSEESEL